MLETIKKRLKHRLGVPSVTDSLILAQNNGFQPKVIFDIGAYQGTWTQEISRIFPESKFFMFEAQSSKEEFLRNVCKLSNINAEYHIGVLGAEHGKEVVFHEYETASSVHEEYNETGATKRVKSLEKLDKVVESRGWPQPDLIKLDTQGYELEVLKGGCVALKKAEFVLMEVSLLEIYKGAPLLEDVILQMSNWGYQLYDICSLMRRPLDKALFQTDLLFIKKDSQFILNKHWA